MKAIVLKPQTTQAQIKEVKEPSLSLPTQVKVKVLEVGICGTDMEQVHGGRSDAPFGEDHLIIGHEMLAEVIKVGKKVKLCKPKDLVVMTVRRGCAQCTACQHGRFDFCISGKYKERGIKKLHGYQCEYALDDEAYCIYVPRSLRKIAVLTEPTSVVEKAIDELCQVQSKRLSFTQSSPWVQGKTILVAGLGPIGLLASMLLSLRGAKVLGLDIEPKDGVKASLLKQMGGTYIQSIGPLKKAFAPYHIDAIIEAAGIAQLDFALIELLATNGAYVLTGVPADQKPIAVQAADIMKQLVLKNQILLGSVNASFEHFQMAIKDLEAGYQKWPHTIASIITHRFFYEDFHQAFFEKHKNAIKQVISWDRTFS